MGNTEINIFFEQGREQGQENFSENFSENFDFDEIKINEKFEKFKDDKNMTFFRINKDILPLEVFTVKSTFPLIFKNCKANILSFSMIFFLGGFVVVVLLSIYL